MLEVDSLEFYQVILRTNFVHEVRVHTDLIIFVNYFLVVEKVDEVVQVFYFRLLEIGYYEDTWVLGVGWIVVLRLWRPVAFRPTMDELVL